MASYGISAYRESHIYFVQAPDEAALQGKWHRHAHDEHEKGLDEVPKAQPVPGVVVKLLDKAMPEKAFWKCLCECPVFSPSLPRRPPSFSA